MELYVRMAECTRVVMFFDYGILVLVVVNNCLYIIWLCSFSVASYDSCW